MKVIDAFVFFNEYELAESRLRYYADVVDHFVITESSLTWKAGPNNQKFPTLLEKLPQNIKDKITYKFIEHPVEWTNDRKKWKWPEGRTKNAMAFIAKEIANDDDLFLFSDIDEFWSIDKLDEAKEVANNNYWFAFKQMYRVVHIHWSARYGDQWYGTRGCLVKNLVGESPLINDIITFKKSKTFQENLPPVIEDGGWHFSYFGNTQQRLLKLESLTELKHWEEKTGRSYKQIAQAGKEMGAWNNSVGKKKTQARHVPKEVKHLGIDKSLLKIMLEFDIFFSEYYRLSEDYKELVDEIQTI